MSHSNILSVMASLPPHIFLSQVFSASIEIRMAYKLNGIIAYTGAHYMVFLRVRVGGANFRSWVLFNDDEKPKQFNDFIAVAEYLVQSNVMPTLVIFEGFPYTE